MPDSPYKLSFKLQTARLKHFASQIDFDCPQSALLTRMTRRQLLTVVKLDQAVLTCGFKSCILLHWCQQPQQYAEWHSYGLHVLLCTLLFFAATRNKVDCRSRCEGRCQLHIHNSPVRCVAADSLMQWQARASCSIAEWVRQPKVMKSAVQKQPHYLNSVREPKFARLCLR